MAEFKGGVDQYDRARAVTNIQVLQDYIRPALNDLPVEIP